MLSSKEDRERIAKHFDFHFSQILVELERLSLTETGGNPNMMNGNAGGLTVGNKAGADDDDKRKKTPVVKQEAFDESNNQQQSPSGPAARVNDTEFGTPPALPPHRSQQVFDVAVTDPRHENHHQPMRAEMDLPLPQFARDFIKGTVGKKKKATTAPLVVPCRPSGSGSFGAKPRQYDGGRKYI